MGAWGRGVWHNDSALDDFGDVCDHLWSEAKKRVEDFGDRTEILDVLAYVEMLTVLSSTTGLFPGVTTVEIKSLRSAAIAAWRKEVDPRLFEDPREKVSDAKRAEWQSDIEACFDRLLTHAQKFGE